jgi:hypothetical protein
MKIITTLSVLLIALTTNIAFAQTANITGKTSTENKSPLSFVTISLLKKQDSSLVKVAISNETGNFTMENIASGNYLLKFTNVGFEQMFLPIDSLQFNSNSLDIKNVVLNKTVQSLTTHTVIAKKPMIEVKADKMIFNVESSINATGSDAFELLRKSPGVMVDNNDNISMKGKTGVKIYIDGKPTQFSSSELASFLKSINSADIEAIEMISNPSAKYDAAGNAGVINFRLKKNKKYGTNGNVTAGYTQGITPKFNESIGLNYRNKKVNLFGNFGHSTGTYQNGMNINRIQLDTTYDLKSVNKNDNKNFNYKVGADYFLNKKSTIGFISTLNNSDGTQAGNGITPIYYYPTGGYVKTLVANSNGKGGSLNINNNFNYRYADTSGTEINFDADYGTFRKTGEVYQPNFYNDINGNLIYKVVNRNNMPVNIDIFSAKVDVEHNWGKSKIGYGAKTSFVKTENTFEFYNDDTNGIPIIVLSRSNYFTYNENVNALYANYNRALNKKWNLQAGIRMEQTNSKGVLTRADSIVQADNTVKRNYADLFPSGALTYTYNDKNTFNLTYSKRIDRPTYQDLNPFENKLDELTYQKGNAFLQPQYTNNVELSHTYMGFLTSTITYGHTRDFATEITDTLGNATYVQQQNLADLNYYGFSVGSATPFKKWWSGYINIWYMYHDIKGSIGENPFHVKIPLYGAYWQQSFTLKKEFSAELSGWYNGPAFWVATWKTSPQWSMDLELQKTFFNKNLTVKGAVTDIFYTAPWKATNNFGGLNINANGNWESRTFRLTVNWRFGSNQISASRERKTASESEAKRIKG